MDDLIEALTIFRKYGNPYWPTHCEHDELIFCVDPRVVEPQDIVRLDELSVHADYDEEVFFSFRFGSA